MDKLYIIAGLGNPGLKYAGTRHNLGFLTIDAIEEKTGIRVRKLRHKALTGEGSIAGAPVILVKPQTFMNSSGESIREIVEWYNIPTERLIVIHDDIDIGTGRIRIKGSGSAGTHNGMRSVIYHLCSDTFPRIRIGIGRPPEGWELIDYVLGRIRGEEAELLKPAVIRAAEAVEAIIGKGIEAAMNAYNGAAKNGTASNGSATDDKASNGTAVGSTAAEEDDGEQ